MGGSIHIRIAAVVLALALLSTAASCFAIATHAQEAMAAAARDRLQDLADYLRDAAAGSAGPEADRYGHSNLELLLEAAVERDEDLRLAAVLGPDGQVLYATGRGDAGPPRTGPLLRALPAPEELEIRTVGDDIVARIALPAAQPGPAAHIVLAVPRDRLAPQVERLIAVMLGDGLVFVAALAPLAFLGTAVVLHPLRRSARIAGAALRALGQNRLPPIPDRMQALDGGGDPLWDAPGPDDAAHAYLELVEAFARARAGHAAAIGRLQRLERRIARFDTLGAEALAEGRDGRRQELA